MNVHKYRTFADFTMYINPDGYIERHRRVPAAGTCILVFTRVY